MMAGHTLLKVILGFAWTILVMSEILFIVNFFPIIILILLTVLEIGVSVIQAYIFSILTCLYLRDAFKGH
jgi:F-type H+-transporting ATPase subunit a